MRTTRDRPEPQVKRQSDFDNLRRTLLRQGPPGPVPFVELFADPGMIEAVLGEKFTWDALAGGERADAAASGAGRSREALDVIVRFCYEIGYDYVYAWPGLSFPRANFGVAADTAAVGNWSGDRRFWQDESTGPIQNWADFEAYPWPKAEDISYRAIEYLSEVVPDGMKVCANLGGIFENSSWLMGFQAFSYALYDDPDLIEAICQRVGELTATAAAHVVTVDNVGMVFLGDDLGYATGTLVAPAVLRKYIFPRQRRLVEIARAAGKPFLLHSCGNLEKIMDDLIDDVGIDAKHSFEDKFITAEEAYRRWGDRITILAGVDMDDLARGSEDRVRRRTREILEVCAVKGTGYCLSTGNTPANYVPRENFLAMLDEGRKWNRAHFGAP